ncbi:hypothetical protein CYMTET_55407 [Cymbomonas tetramitiformis]|uniref:C2 domain-containing protein n=1 Tax=Cymbomonas tetramitiformis TaxID=36881 RepID=A0AAE0BD24_9CHLO|nr:hypothetical protein CYMTET_55407 [Cymbomonas tetramitiformis]
MSSLRRASNVAGSKRGLVTVTLHRAEDLISADINGKSDPYVKLYLKAFNDTGDTRNMAVDDSVKKTAVKKGTLAPTWEESFSFDLEVFGEHACLRFDVWDYDVASAHDWMGECEVALDKLIHDPNSPPLLNQTARLTSNQKLGPGKVITGSVMYSVTYKPIKSDILSLTVGLESMKNKSSSYSAKVTCGGEVQKVASLKAMEGACTWPTPLAFEVIFDTLNSKMDKPILIKIVETSGFMMNSETGRVETTVGEVLEKTKASGTGRFPLKSGNTSPGTVVLVADLASREVAPQPVAAGGGWGMKAGEKAAAEKAAAEKAAAEKAAAERAAAERAAAERAAAEKAAAERAALASATAAQRAAAEKAAAEKAAAEKAAAEKAEAERVALAAATAAQRAAAEKALAAQKAAEKAAAQKAAAERAAAAKAAADKASAERKRLADAKKTGAAESAPHKSLNKPFIGALGINVVLLGCLAKAMFMSNSQDYSCEGGARIAELEGQLAALSGSEQEVVQKLALTLQAVDSDRLAHTERQEELLSCMKKLAEVSTHDTDAAQLEGAEAWWAWLESMPVLKIGDHLVPCQTAAIVVGSIFSLVALRMLVAFFRALNRGSTAARKEQVMTARIEDLETELNELREAQGVSKKVSVLRYELGLLQSQQQQQQKQQEDPGWSFWSFFFGPSAFSTV